jgi:hypothetical protein
MNTRLVALVLLFLICVAAGIVLLYGNFFSHSVTASNQSSTSIKVLPRNNNQAEYTNFNVDMILNSTYLAVNKFAVLEELSALPRMYVNSSNENVSITLSGSKIMIIQGSKDNISVTIPNNAVLVIRADSANMYDTVIATGGYIYNTAIPEAGVNLELHNSTLISV